jgi:hypothetical protein
MLVTAATIPVARRRRLSTGSPGGPDVGWMARSGDALGGVLLDEVPLT